MKQLIVNVATGIILILMSILLTLNNYWLFSIGTPLVLFVLFLIYYFINNNFSWFFVLLTFIVNLIVTLNLMDFLGRTLLSVELFDDEYFPTAQFIRISVILFVINKIILDSVLSFILPKKYVKISNAQKWFLY
jgi:hypothetical protein